MKSVKNDDWELNDNPVIEPALSSEYVTRVWPEFNAWRLKTHGD